jgi:hypothetical protein
MSKTANILRLLYLVAALIWLLHCYSIGPFANSKAVASPDFFPAYFLMPFAVVCFPIGTVLVLAVGYLVEIGFDAVSLKSPVVLMMQYLFLVLAGYLQWFVLLPWVLRRVRRRAKRDGLISSGSEETIN